MRPGATPTTATIAPQAIPTTTTRRTAPATGGTLTYIDRMEHNIATIKGAIDGS